MESNSREPQLPSAPIAAEGPSVPPSLERSMSVNEAIEEIRRRTRLIECAIALLLYHRGVDDAPTRELSYSFKLWIHNNEIFEESLVDRYLDAVDLIHLSTFLRRMEYLQRLLPDPLDDDPPSSPACYDLRGSQDVVDSLLRIGQAMRTELPSHYLVRKIRKVLNGKEGDFMNMISLSDISQEIRGTRMRLRPGELESLTSQISEQYRVVFATLVLIYKPIRIFGLMEEGISDDKLPITEEFLFEGLKRRGWTPQGARQFVFAQNMILDRLEDIAYEMKQKSSETVM
ncbi:hypothetical protein O1611_g5100 [Lasiodiplodia mahajangana]|uniref:Uncharacterized protein n=1 Tax=Lasiodiplodia mahajangana TaxID=1108764 RepID=A0ACC2JM32_9PEZI|nr:hypothetical protein O1611_g5100 [Lasiodiplodia mahajangana]